MSARDLIVPIPVLHAGEGQSAVPYVPAASLAFDQALTVKSGPVLTSGGAELEMQTLRRLGFVLTRTVSGAEQVWDTKAEAWVAFDASALAAETLELSPLEPADPVTDGWTGLGALADKKKYPRGGPALYGARAYFQSESPDGEVHFGWSASSSRHMLASGLSLHAGLELEDAEKPAWVRAFVKNEARSVLRSEVLLRRDGAPGVTITVADDSDEKASVTVAEDGHIELLSRPDDVSARARVVLRQDGSIEIQAAPSRSVTLQGVEVRLVGGEAHIRATGGAVLVLDGPVRIEGNLHVAGHLTAQSWGTP